MCATNGKSYMNPCLAACAISGKPGVAGNANVAYTGACKGECVVACGIRRRVLVVAQGPRTLSGHARVTAALALALAFAS